MIDRIIGIVGLALTCITAVLPSYFSQLPFWLAQTAFGIGLFLFGLSCGLLATGGQKQKPSLAACASLRLHVYGDHRTPDRLSSENIFRFYYLQTSINGVSPDGVVAIGVMGTLVLSFERDVIISTIRVRSPDMQLPVYEVKEFNQRYAIIVFSGNVPAGTLEISVAP